MNDDTAFNVIGIIIFSAFAVFITGIAISIVIVATQPDVPADRHQPGTSVTVCQK